MNKLTTERIKIFLTEFLQIIGYEGDLVAYVSQIESAVKTDTVLSLIESLSTERRNEVLELIKPNKTDLNKTSEILGKYFSPTEVAASFQQSLTKIVSGLFAEVKPKLQASDCQRVEDWLQSQTKTK